MPSETQTLILEMKADLAKYNASVIKSAEGTEKFQKKTSTEFTKVEKKAKKTANSLFQFSSVAKGVFAALSVRTVINFADQIQVADNQLRNVTTSTEQFNFVQMELNRIALETRQNVNELTSVYARFSRAGQEAGFTQKEILELTESLTKAFKIEGNTTAEVNSTLLQLTQGFRSGRIAGEEFRAVSEASTLVLQALSKQLGVSVGDLKDLASQGQVTPQALIDGLKQIKPEVDKQFSSLAPTFAEVGASLGNTFAKAFRTSGAGAVLDDIKRGLVAGLAAIDFGLTDDGQIAIKQLELIDKVGIDATASIRGMAVEISDLRSEILKSTKPDEVVKLKEKIDELKTEMRLTAKEAAGFSFFGTADAVRDFSLLIIKMQDAKNAAKELSGGGEQATPKERESIVSLDLGEEKLVEQGSRRLDILREQSEAERQLLLAANDQIISDQEAALDLKNRKELDRFDEAFATKLERLTVTEEQLAEIKALANELGMEKLTEDEQKLLTLEQSFSDARVAIIETQEQKISRIKEIARKNDIFQTISVGSKLLGAISKTAKEGSAIQEGAARLSIIANTAAGMMRQYADLPYPAALLTKGAIFLEGISALSAVGGGGGGSIPSGGGGAGDASAGQPDAAPDQSVSITDITGGDISREEIIVRLTDESGDDLAVAIGSRIKNAESDGRV